MAIASSLLLLGMFTLYFRDFLENRDNPNRGLEVAPGQELVLKRGRDGHYTFPGRINQQPVMFLLDTGATYVAIPAQLGSRLGLAPGMPGQAMTANGVVTAHQTRIDDLAFGPFVIRNLPANLLPGMSNDQILLGMNVLKHLEFTQRGDTLVLRAPAEGP